MKPARRLGFTLIELLTVITIIAILVALLFPAVKAAIIKAETARARTMVQHIGAAFRSYYVEYSIWPTSSAGTVTFDLTTNLFRNTASITFLDVSAKDIYPTNILYAKGTILDPWQHPYRCRVDGDFANNGTLANPFSGGATINAGYAIWSDGPDGTNDTGAAQDAGLNKDNIRSW